MIEIIYEDDFIVAINKPNNVLVHHSVMANNQLDELSLMQLMFAQTETKYYAIHRLDRKTSGIILLAKKKEFVSKFQELFVNNQIQKKYYGLVRGFAPESGKIDSPVKGRDANKHKEALTFFERLERFHIDVPVGPYPSARYSLITLTPKTGRLHQLRIHLNKISYPLVGDPKYGDRFHNRMFETEFDCSKLFLHAFHLEFVHPFTQKNISITAKKPTHWELVFNLMRQKSLPF
ncbi:pseudouridine synthase [Wenyingzhuangia sp. 2_MG-2023]|uniref:pseudouridine synthase n=1 Tax=Wenyingzhuangia sp. 2_MG-2023 TaxID=3062639 RepID=UPI0026E3C5A1|nr:pseudouridine synthase [Wenyingzhuangia sp. 2_MG-2023]MDO6737438.1 pseudouridine synthase [Wenyingzhuangia sp. 2_MG-2023]